MVREVLRRLLVLLCGAVLVGDVLADSWRDPHPWRREALLQGRDFDYDDRSFLQRLSYRPLFPVPQDQDGVFGSAGSVSSRELFMESDFRKTLRFDNEQHELRFRYRRAEDFDGYFDRQLVGYGLYLQDWRLGVAGDVRGDKAETDVYFELGWRPQPGSLVTLNYILPDAYFNQKSSLDGEYLRDPQSWFLQGLYTSAAGWQWELNATLSPKAEFVDPSLAVEAAGEQQRVMAGLTVPGRWRWQLRAEAERVERQFRFDDGSAPVERTFSRRMHSVTASVQASEWTLTPTFGAHYFSLREDGWLGVAQSVTVRERYQEPYGFVALTQALTDRWRWQPTAYWGQSDIVQQYQEDPERNKDRRRWQGKLSLPFSYLTDVANGGYLTISPSFYLHKAAFGGGNVQVHWPF